MKKLYYILILTLLVAVISCGDDGISFSNPDSGSNNGQYINVNYDTSGSVGGHYYVDLGLSVMWATCNIGASTALMSGSYFAWGEVTPKESYSWETYIHCDKDNKFTKYCYKKESGSNELVDSLYTLQPEDDAAVQNWGNGWRMPTDAEFEELRTKCHWEWVSGIGVYYYKVTGSTGKSIMIPACGSMKDRIVHSPNSNGCLWTSNISNNKTEHACELTLYATGFWKGSVDRFYGEPIRPVIEL